MDSVTDDALCYSVTALSVPDEREPSCFPELPQAPAPTVTTKRLFWKVVGASNIVGSHWMWPCAPTQAFSPAAQDYVELGQVFQRRQTANRPQVLRNSMA
jgi:hypothetical protein